MGAKQIPLLFEPLGLLVLIWLALLVSLFPQHVSGSLPILASPQPSPIIFLQGQTLFGVQLCCLVQLGREVGFPFVS